MAPKLRHNRQQTFLKTLTHFVAQCCHPEPTLRHMQRGTESPNYTETICALHNRCKETGDDTQR